MSTNSAFDTFPDFTVERFASYPGVTLPPPHPAEADTFDRQTLLAGHDQDLIRNSRLTLVGAGGINGATMLGAARMGFREITCIDPDLVERTNLPRQMFYGSDLGFNKAVRLAHNTAAFATDGGTFTGIGVHVQQALEQYVVPTDVLLVGVDNNAARLYCAQWARRRRIPAVFTMLSRTGWRCQTFLQGQRPDDACLWCALPNLDPATAAPCAAAVVSACFLAASLSLTFAYRAILGWPAGMTRINWHDVDLSGQTPDVAGMIQRRPNCPVCGAQ